MCSKSRERRKGRENKHLYHLVRVPHLLLCMWGVSIITIAGSREKWQSRGEHFPHFAVVLRLVRGSGCAWGCSSSGLQPELMGWTFPVASFPRSLLILRSASVIAEDFVSSGWFLPCIPTASSQKHSLSQRAARIAGGEERLQRRQGLELCLVLPAHGQGGFPKTESTEWGFA